MKKIFTLIGCILLLASCASSRSTTQMGPEMRFMGTQLDGSITMRVSAAGRNFSDAVEQAKKYAVREIIFKGINVPDNTFMSKPIVTGVNAEEKHQNFFNAFFADGGEYTGFVTSEDKRSGSNRRSKTNVQVRAQTTVRVLRVELKQYLMDNGIIKP